MTLPGLEPVAPGRPRLTSVAILYLLRLRRRWFAELLAVLAVAAGVALVHVAAVAATSPSASVRALSDSVVGHSDLQLVARGGTRVPQALHDRIAALPGVRWIAPVLHVPGNVVGRRGDREATFFGADPRTITLSGSLLDGLRGGEAAQQEAVVLPLPLARAAGIGFGDDARVQMAGRTLTLPIIVAGREQIAALVDSPIGLVPLRYLQRLARTGPAMSRMLIAAEPGRVAEVRAAARRLAGTRADVFGADHESRLFAVAARPMDRAAAVFAVLAGVVGGLLAACALLVSATDRRRMAEQQRAQGLGLAARRATLLVDAAAVGALGTLLGLALGEALSRTGSFSDVSILSGAFPVDDRRLVSARSVALAGAAGLTAATLGVLAPLRRRDRAARSRGGRTGPWTGGPAARTWRQGSVLGGLAALGGALALLVAAPAAAIVGTLLLVLSLALLTCAALPAAGAALATLSRRLGPPSTAVLLAVQGLPALRRRPGAPAVALTAALTVFGASALHGAQRGLQTGLDRATAVAGPADVWVAPAGAGSALGTTPFDPRHATAIAGLPEVARTTPYRSAFLDVAGRRAWVLGQPGDVLPVPAGQVVAGPDATAVARRVRAGGWATLSTDLARALHVGVGRSVVLPTPRPLRVRVAATTTNLGWPSGAIVLGAADYRRAWGAETVSAFRVTLAPGVTPRAGRDAIATALRGASWLHAETAAARADRSRAVARAGPARLRQIARLTLLTGLLALAATMTAVLWRQRAPVAHLRADGPAAGQIRRALVVEIGLVLSTGAALGALYGLLGQIVVAAGLRALTSFPVVVAVRPASAVATLGATLAVGLGIAIVVATVLVAAARSGPRR